MNCEVCQKEEAVSYIHSFEDDVTEIQELCDECVNTLILENHYENWSRVGEDDDEE